jgi:hypothetical protein
MNQSQKLALKKFLAGMTLALSLCFAAQACLYYLLNGGTGKGESNYFSTLSRFQAAAAPAAKIAFAGSSITGRIPGREAGNDKVANLGSDGGPALDGIRTLVNGSIAAPRCLVIETNTLYGGVGSGETSISGCAKRPWFYVGARIPLLGASARPTAMLYSKLLRRPKVLIGEPFLVMSDDIATMAGKTVEDFSKVEKKRFHDYVDGIKQLQNRGVKIVLVKYPAGEMSEHEKILMEVTLSEFKKRFPVAFLDLEKQISRDSLHFTDSVHLGPESAARILSTIANFCENNTTSN